jgi:uncharacterized protein (DUF433 family)
MSLYHDNKPAITRTERGLTIAGTRITLYQIMDYIHASYPRHLIRHQFYLTDEQFDAALSYIEAHYEEVESEYQIVLQQAAEIQNYWQERNKERIANISTLPPKSEYVSAWQKLQARKAKRAAISQ